MKNERQPRFDFDPNESAEQKQEQKKDDNPDYGSAVAEESYKKRLKQDRKALESRVSHPKKEEFNSISDFPAFNEVRRKVMEMAEPTKGKVLKATQPFNKKMAQGAVATYELRLREFMHDVYPNLSPEEKLAYDEMSYEDKVAFREKHRPT